MRFLIISLALLVAFTGIVAVNAQNMSMAQGNDLMTEKPDGFAVATLAGGCFWCVESEFRARDGVLFTRSGYTGGDIDNPTYRQITTGKTGHAEAVEITFDPAKVTYKDLLMYFFTAAHDPTQLNRQGVDVGPQYRSAVFYHDEQQKREAQDVIAALEDSQRFKKPIVTALKPAVTFWEAEEYHQQYYEKYEEKTGKPHIRVVIKNINKQKAAK